MAFSVPLKARTHSSKRVMNQQQGLCVKEITLLFSSFRRKRQMTGKQDQVRKFVFKGTSSTEHRRVTGFIPTAYSAFIFVLGPNSLYGQSASLQDSPSSKEHAILHSGHCKRESRQGSFTKISNIH